MDPMYVTGELIQSLKQISVRCMLKRLYLWIHNKEKMTELELESESELE
jgi:hypothetical protein